MIHLLDITGRQSGDPFQSFLNSRILCAIQPFCFPMTLTV